MIEKIKDILKEIDVLDIEDKIKNINLIRKMIHEISPFKEEPVDYVEWVKNEKVQANDYNPNKVAPPEMELLRISILEDGYTQPIVTFPVKDIKEVVDGFHRNRVGKEYKDIEKRVMGYLPIVSIRNDRTNKGDRIASTIRHNRARGKHIVDAMSEIVLELKNRNWTNQRISRELGMDEEEILRLCQITGLEELFSDEDFSKSWNIEDSEDDFDGFTDEVTEIEKEENDFRTINTSDKNRIFHTFDKWECYKAGFYNTTKDGMSQEECEREYLTFMTNENEFRKALEYIINNWKYSCEHYLTNKSMNRIAWLGQAAICYARGIPSKYRSGFYLLSEDQQNKANEIAFEYLNKWLEKNGLENVEFNEAVSLGRQVEIY